MCRLYEKAKTTIEVLVANMVRPDICNHVLFNHYQNVTPTNVIKLLMRVKRLYDSRNEAVNILKNVAEVEAVIKPKSEIWRIIQDNDNSRLSDNHYKVINRTLNILSQSLSKITIFQQEHRLFKNEFQFNKVEYRDFICDIGCIIGGFLKLKNKANPALQMNGLLLDKHDETRDQQQRYQEWVQKSLDDYGRLDLPSNDVEKLILPEVPVKQMSRVEKALNRIKEEESASAKLMGATASSGILGNSFKAYQEKLKASSVK